jgi:hypothetical protein
MSSPESSTNQRHPFSVVEFIGWYLNTLGYGVLAIVGAVALLAIAPVASFFGLSWEVRLWVAAALLIGGCLFLIPSILGFRRRIKWLELTDSLMRWQVGGRVEEERWDDVRHYYFADVIENDLRWRRAIVVFATRSSPLEIPQSLHKFRRAANEIQRRSYPARRQAIQQDYQLGKSIAFGPITLNQDSLGVQGTICTWAEVDRVSVSHGHLCVFHHGKRMPIETPLRTIPDYDVLLDLLHRRGCRIETG